MLIGWKFPKCVFFIGAGDIGLWAGYLPHHLPFRAGVLNKLALDPENRVCGQLTMHVDQVTEYFIQDISMSHRGAAY